MKFILKKKKAKNNEGVFKPSIKCCFFPSSALRQMLWGLNVTLCYAKTRFNLLFVVNGPKCFSLCSSTVLVHWLLIASVVHFCLNLLGFSFIFWWFSHPAVLLLQVKNGPKEKKNKTRKGITVVHVSTPPLFVRVREHRLLLDCAVYFYITHTSRFVFRLSGIFCLFTPAGQTGVSDFCFPARLISIAVCVRTEKKHSKADKRKKKVREVLRSRSLSK